MNELDQLPIRRWNSGEFVFEQGELGRHMYWIKSGTVEVLARTAMGLTPIAVLSEDDFFGEMALLEGLPRSATIRVLDDMVAVEIDSAGFDRLLVRQPEFLVRMLRKLSRRLSQAQSELAAGPDSDKVSQDKQITGMFDASTLPGVSSEQINNALKEESAYLLYPVNGQSIRIPALQTITLGRSDPATGISPDIDLGHLDSQQTLSRRHARLLFSGREWRIEEELGTVNGTFVNGRKLQPGVAVKIHNGDQITLGLMRLTFRT